MKVEEINIEEIIVRYLTGKSNEKECVYLEEWISQDEQNKLYFDEMYNIWHVMSPAFDPETIDVESAYNKVLPVKRRVNKIQNIYTYFQRIAAILFIPLFCTLLYMMMYSSQKSYSEIVYQEVSAPYGTRIQINLPDGSLVSLNAGGKLKFPKEFISGERNVYLIGEAYFEVQSDKKNPFVVHTDAMDITATGTAFNVDASKNSPDNAVTLVKGIVEVKLDKKNKTLDLKPGQRISYNTENLNYRLEEVDTYKWCAWKDGYLIFRDDPLEEVFGKLGQIYNVEIVIEDQELAKCPLRATFSDESINDVLKLIQMSMPITYIEHERKAVSDGSFTKRYIKVRKVKT